MSQDLDPSVAYAHNTPQLDSEDVETANVLIQEAMRGDRFECRKPPLLMRGDCLELMGLLPDNSVDLIISDPPCDPMEGDGYLHPKTLNKMWAQYNRLLKPKGIVVLFACATRGNHRESSFLAKLITSNAEDFRYHMVWHKNNMTNPTNVTQTVLPLRDHEDILVFYRQPGTYNPQMTKKTGNKNGIGEKEKYPRSVIEGFKPIPRPFHPEEKPVPLLEYLVKMYSNPADVVLDNTMGSGSTGVASLKNNRGFIGIEINPLYYSHAEARVSIVQPGVQVEDTYGITDAVTDEVMLPDLKTKFDSVDYLQYYRAMEELQVPRFHIEDKIVEYLNQYFKIIHQPTYMVVEITYHITKHKTLIAGHHLSSEAQIKKRLQKCMFFDEIEEKLVPVYQIWAKHEKSEEYKELVFSPTEKQSEEQFNTFYGIQSYHDMLNLDFYQLKLDGIQIILDHVLALAGGDKFCMGYLLDWLAYPIQTGCKTEVAVIVRGLQGCGKNLFFSRLMGEKIYGMKYYTEIAGGSTMFENFNSHLSSKMYMVIDEPNKVSAKNRNLLKNYITSNKKEVRAKYQDAQILEDYTNFVFTCNEIPDDLLEFDDRRFFVIQHTGVHVQDLEYSSRLVKAIDEHYLDFYHFLKLRTINTFRVGRSPPQTKIKKKLRYTNIDPVFQYIRYLLEGGYYNSNGISLFGGAFFAKRADFFASCQKWCASEKIKHPAWKDVRSLQQVLQTKFPDHNWESTRKVEEDGVVGLVKVRQRVTARVFVFPNDNVMKKWLIDANLWMTEEEHEQEDTAERDAAKEYQEAQTIEITESQEEELEKNLKNTELINELCAGIAKLTTQGSITKDEAKIRAETKKEFENDPEMNAESYQTLLSERLQALSIKRGAQKPEREKSSTEQRFSSFCADVTADLGLEVSDDETPIDDEITEEDDEYAAMLSRYIELEEEVRRENERIQHVRQMDWESDHWDEE